MANHKDLYSKAQQVIVQKGWTKGAMQNNRGVCLLGALQSGAGATPANMGSFSDPKFVSERVLDQVIAKIHHKPLYMLAFMIYCANDYGNKSRRIAFWNDAPWRRKKTVLAIFAKLEKEEEVAWLQDEVSRLQIIIGKMRFEKEQLEARIERLSAKNRLLQKALHLEQDKVALLELDRELDRTINKLEELTNL